MTDLVVADPWSNAPDAAPAAPAPPPPSGGTLGTDANPIILGPNDPTPAAGLSYVTPGGVQWSSDGRSGSVYSGTGGSAAQAAPAPAASPGLMSADELWGPQDAPAPPPPPAPPPTFGGVAKATGSGLLGSIMGNLNLIPLSPPAIGNTIDQATKIGNWGASKLGLISPEQGDQDVAGITGMRQAAGLSTPAEMQQQAGLLHSPQNFAERVGNTVGGLLPGVLAGPEAGAGILPQIAQRVGANVIAPAVGSLGASEGVRAMGGNQTAQDIAGTVGGILGGGMANTRFRTGSAAPAPLPGMDTVPAPVLNRAAKYVATRASTTSGPMMEAASAGKPVILAQKLGNTGQTALGSLARQPGATGDLLDAYARGEGGVIDQHPARVQSHFEGLTGISPEAATGNIEAYVDAGRKAVAPLYDKALSNPAPLWTPDLATLAQRPVIAKAISTVANNMRNSGQDPGALDWITNRAMTPRTVQPGRTIASPPKITDAPTAVSRPTAETWDLIRKAVGFQVERNPVTGKPLPNSQSPGNVDVNNATRDLTSTLRARIPGYGDALDQSGDYLSAQNAFERGQHAIMSPKVSTAQFQSMMDGLKPGDLGAFKGGVANHIFTLAQNARLSPKSFRTPAIAGKLAAAMGPEAAAKFLKGGAQEKAIIDSLQQMLPNSGPSTAKYVQEMASQNEVHPALQHGAEFLTNTVLAGPHVAGAKLGMGFAGKVAPMIAKRFSTMTEPVRDAAGKILMSPTIQPQDVIDYAKAAKAAKPGLFIKSPSLSLLPAAPRPAPGIMP